jgi:hypothetical protein
MTINIKIPKRIGGIKIDKKLRRKAKKLLKLADSPAVRIFASAGVSPGRGRADNDDARDETDTAPNGNGPRVTFIHGGTTTRVNASKFADAVRAAAVDGLTRFLSGLEEGLREASATVEATVDAKVEIDPEGEESVVSEAKAPRSPRKARPARPARAPRAPRPPRSSRPDSAPPEDAAPE